VLLYSMFRFAKNLRPGDKTSYGQVVASQLSWERKQVQLTIAGNHENVYLSNYKLIRIRRGN
jgi:hypothetical protein